MAGDCDKRMTTGTHTCGFGVGFVGSATRPSRSCPTGWFRLGTMACVADNRPATSSRALSGSRWMGLCPLHTDHKPSFLVDPNKNLFYCYGCGRGGDVIRFAELYHQVTLLRQWCGLAPLMNAVIDFYCIQLQRYNEAV